MVQCKMMANGMNNGVCGYLDVGGGAIAVGRIVVRAAERVGLHPGAHAVFLADQSKAFERLSYAWITGLFQAMELPAYARTALLSLIVGRKVRARVLGQLGSEHDLECGAGMGGPASPLCWDTAYDPIIWAACVCAA